MHAARLHELGGGVTAPLASVPVTSTPPATATATPGTAGSVTVGSGANAPTVSWPSTGLATTPVKVSVTPVAATAISVTGGFAAGTTAVQVTVANSAGDAVTAFDAPLDVTFPGAAADVVPAYSHDGTTWTAIPQIVSPPTLPDGWYRDSSGLLHVLTRHATFFAVLNKGATVSPALVLKTGVRPTLNLNYSRKLSFYAQQTFPGTLTITLKKKGAKKVLGSWHPTVAVQTKVITIVVPKAARKKGTYLLSIVGAAGLERTTQTTTLTFVAKPRVAL